MLDTEDVQTDQLPSDPTEYRAVAFDDASLNGSMATLGLPLQSAFTPDGDVQHPAELGKYPFSTEQLTELERLWALTDAVKQAINQAGLYLIENYEGYSSVAYYDSVGVKTIGYGTTAAVVNPVPDTCTRMQAQAWLVDSLARTYEPAIRATGCPLNQNEFNALCSFVYNLGPGSMSSTWRIGAALRAHNLAEVRAVWTSYDTAGGVVLPGLHTRRVTELEVFNTPMPAPKPVPYAYMPDTAYKISGKSYVERAIVEDFVSKYPHRAEKAIKADLVTLQAEIVKMRKRDWAVAHETKPAAWVDNRHFGERWQELEKLSKQAL
jgi:lysozyme